MATYLVTVEDAESHDVVYKIEAKSQRDAADDVLKLEEGSAAQVKVYTLAKGSPVTTFRRRTETRTVLEKVEP